MSFKKTVSLRVLMNGNLVEWLRSSSQGVLSYSYEDVWLDFDNRRPISLSLPLSRQEYSGHIVEHYFDNLLPDSLAIRSRLQ
jgi:serine/threonine-protein kinase HipA